MIMRAATRPIDDTSAAGTAFDIERPDYEACLAVVQAEVPKSHHLLSI